MTMDSEPQLRFAIAGARRGASIARALETTGRAIITAVYDPNTSLASAVAEEFGARAPNAWSELLEEAFDAAIVASPAPSRAEQAVELLYAGKGVVSEVPACTSWAPVRDLVDAVQRSGHPYMLAETYRYLDEVELIRRIFIEGSFGDVYFGEGEYVHDCRALWYGANAELTWRAEGWPGVYCTHSLGPLLYITGDRVVSITATEVGGRRFDSEVPVPTMTLMDMTTVGGRVLRVRVDPVSPRPHRMAYYALQGTRGCYESWRGCGDASKIWLADRHGESRVDSSPDWHALDALASTYIPERLNLPAHARAGGHGTSEYWMARDIVGAMSGELPSAIDIYAALDYTLPGLAARESIDSGGVTMKLADPRQWAGVDGTRSFTEGRRTQQLAVVQLDRNDKAHIRQGR